MTGGHDTVPAPHPVATRDMGISHADLARLLPRVDEAGSVEWDGGVVRLRTATVRVEIRVGPERERRIATLRLPTTALEFHLLDGGAGDFAAFLERFDRTFHKGGG